MSNTDDHQLRNAVRDSYAGIARREQSSCCGGGSGCGDDPQGSLALGYTADQLAALPEGADLGLGCGNPQGIASLQNGETVVDLGSGAGIDCFLAAQTVGDAGRVIGVDMTPEMIDKARTNLGKTSHRNVEFRLGEIEHLPIADNTVDVIISNCVINLSPNKAQVFSDAYRVLKPGGRLAISDVVASCELPEHIRNDLRLYSGCMAGASPIDRLQTMLSDAGFVDVDIKPQDASREFIRHWAPGTSIEQLVMSADIRARKPQA